MMPGGKIIIAVFLATLIGAAVAVGAAALAAGDIGILDYLTGQARAFGEMVITAISDLRNELRFYVQLLVGGLIAFRVMGWSTDAHEWYLSQGDLISPRKRAPPRPIFSGKTRFIACAILFVLFVFTLPFAEAAAADADDVGSLQFLSDKLLAYETALNTIVDNVLESTSVYVQHTRIVLIAFLVLSLVITLSKWVFSQEVLALFAWVVNTLLILLLYTSFVFLTSLFWGWMNEVGRAVQIAMVGDPSIYGPASFIAKVASLVNDAGGPWYELSVGAWITALVLYVIAAAVSGVAYVAAAFPVLAYAFMKTVGLFFVPFLFFDRTSKIFDGWFQYFAGFALFAFFSKAVLAVVAILYSVYYDIPYGVSVDQAQILVENTEISSILGVLVLGVGSIGLFVIAMVVSLSIVGGSSFAAMAPQRAMQGATSLGAAGLARASRSIARGITKLLGK